MTRTVTTADGRELRLAASALLPRQYRYHFNRDLILDIKRALEASGKSLAEIQASPELVSRFVECSLDSLAGGLDHCVAILR